MSRRFALCSAAFAAAAVLACHPAAPRLPDPDALAADVTIRRDEFGIPHILARTEEAAAFGFGYAQAEDHAAEIGRRDLSARGEEARYFGESGLANDAGMAQFDNATEARRALRTIPPRLHPRGDSCASGRVQRSPRVRHDQQRAGFGRRVRARPGPAAAGSLCVRRTIDSSRAPRRHNRSSSRSAIQST